MRLRPFLALPLISAILAGCATPRQMVQTQPASRSRPTAVPTAAPTPLPQPPVLTPDQLLGLERPPCMVKDPVSGHYALPAVMDAFQQLKARAAQDGWRLVLVSGYRSFRKQREIWNYYDNLYRKSDHLLSQEDRVRAIMSLVSVPGLSRHHWGTELDISEESLRGRLVRIQPSTPRRVIDYYNWMAEHAPYYGFCRTYLGLHGAVTDEPWHWSYYPYSHIYEQQFKSIKDFHRILDSSVEDVGYVMRHFPAILRQEIRSICKKCR